MQIQQVGTKKKSLILNCVHYVSFAYYFIRSTFWFCVWIIIDEMINY